MDNMQSAAARRAMVRLRIEGWAVGPSAAPDEWRREVRAEARRAGVRIRTGVASLDGKLVPWAFALWAVEDKRRELGGVELDTLGLAAVRAATWPEGD